jgi:WD40 repeat protein
MEPFLSPIGLLKGHTRWVQEVVFSKGEDDLKVISTSNDKTVRIWDIETGTQIGVLTGHSSGTIGLDVSMKNCEWDGEWQDHYMGWTDEEGNQTSQTHNEGRLRTVLA